MAAPALEDYQYQFKDAGILLNSDDYPFFDVEKVSGLDLPDTDPNIDDIDGQHGGTVFVNYVKPRTIVVEGTLYADPTSIEATIDSCISNFIPDNALEPFYFKHPGVAQRYINSKAIAFKSDTDSLRRIGQGAFQIQLVAPDPRKYVVNPDIIMNAGIDYSLVNEGNTNSYPVVTIEGAFTTLTLTNNSQTRSVKLTTTRVAGDITIVDFATRSVTINGVQNSAVVTTAQWWDIPAGGGQTTKYTVTGGPPTTVTLSTKQAWL
jgi:phage-related protein